MLSCLLAIAFSQTGPAATEWTHGDVTVQVQPDRREWKISRRSGNGISFYGYQSIDRIETTPGQLTLRASGIQGGETIVIRPAGESAVRVQATWFSIPTGGAATFVQKFRLDGAFGKATEAPGFEDRWRSPVVSATDGRTLIWIMPTLDKAQPIQAFPRIFDAGIIGRQNARPLASGGLEAIGTPVSFSKPALGLGYGDADFYVSFANSSNPTANRLRVLDDLFVRTAESRKFRAHPQKVPYNIAAFTTYGFRQQVVLNPDDPAYESEYHGSLWESKTEGGKTLGRPLGQSTIHLGETANAMRAAWAMKDWGQSHKQSRWTGYADELARTCIAELSASDTSATTAGQAATAYYALRWINTYPSDPVSQELKTVVNRAIQNLPDRITHPAPATLYAAAQKASYPGATGKQVVNPDHFIRTEIDNPWTLEYLCVTADRRQAANRNLAEQVIAHHAENQLSFDRSELDQLAFFGAFSSGKQGEYASNSPLIAAAIGRLGVIYGNPIWIERGAWGLRAGNNLMTTNAVRAEPDAFPMLPAGQAYPGFGNVRPNMPDPRTSFEGAEGLYLAAVWDLLRETGGFYYLDENRGVGVDGLFMHEGKLYNAFFGNPAPFLRTYQEPTRSARTSNRQDPNIAAAWPAISHIEVVKRGDAFFAVAAPGYDFPNAPKFGEFEFTPRPLSLGENLVQAEVGNLGWEAPLSATDLDQPAVIFRATSPEWSETRAFLPAGWALRGVKHFPLGWARGGDLRWVNPTSPATGDEIDSFAIGTLTSPPFSSEGKGIEFKVTAQGDCSISVRLEQAGTQVAEWHPITPVSGQLIRLELPILTDDRYIIEVIDRDPRGFIRLDDFKLIP